MIIIYYIWEHVPLVDVDVTIIENIRKNNAENNNTVNIQKNNTENNNRVNIEKNNTEN